MIRLLLKKLLQKKNITDSERYNENWTLSAILISIRGLGIKSIRGLFYKLKFGSSKGLVLIGKGTKIFNCKCIITGSNFYADDFCEINGLSMQKLHFGNRVTVGKFAVIRPTNQFGGNLGEGLVIGDNSNIGPFSYIGCSGLIKIGNNVMISPRVSIYSENHNFGSTKGPMKNQGVTRGEVIIEDDCWIAANAIILADVKLGKGSIVAAGSVVTKSFPPYSIIAGNPAKLLKSRE